MAIVAQAVKRNRDWAADSVGISFEQLKMTKDQVKRMHGLYLHHASLAPTGLVDQPAMGLPEDLGVVRIDVGLSICIFLTRADPFARTAIRAGTANKRFRLSCVCHHSAWFFFPYDCAATNQDGSQVDFVRGSYYALLIECV